jgi:glutathione reductase (NADPH)
MEHFDVIVIGTGVAGQTAAEELARAGLRVAVADRREFGGTCLLRGCEPKKVLFSAAEVVERAGDQRGRGPAGQLMLDWASLIAFKKTFTDPMPRQIEQTIADAGATLIHGEAQFTAPDVVAIGGTPYSAEHFVVATGAVPIELGIPGEESVIDHEAFMASDALGGHVVFIGGGYISFEFAHIAATAGAKTTILHRSERVLKGFDPDLAEMLVGSYRASGIDVRTNAPVAEVRRGSVGLEVVLADGSLVTCDAVVHGAGRTPDLSALALDAAGVTHGSHGIEVDSAMRCPSNPRVFAVGDAASLGAPLTPVGVRQARVAVGNILRPDSDAFAPEVVPSVVFAHPPLASVGMTETEAAASPLDVEVRFIDTSGWASSRRIGSKVSGAKTLVERDSGRILGAHLLGHDAAEVINLFAAAVLGGLRAQDLRSAIWAYPTAGYEIVYLV